MAILQLFLEDEKTVVRESCEVIFLDHLDFLILKAHFDENFEHTNRFLRVELGKFDIFTDQKVQRDVRSTRGTFFCRQII